MPLIKNASKNILLENIGLSEIGTFKHKIGSTIEKHYHDCDEYWYFTKGKAIILTDRKVYYAEEGDIVYTKQGNEHAIVEIIEDIEGIYFSMLLYGEKRNGHLHRDYKTQNMLIYGKAGTGKKDFIQNYLIGIQPKANIIMFDIKKEFEIGKEMRFDLFSFNVLTKVSIIRISFPTPNILKNKEKQNTVLKQIEDVSNFKKPLVIVSYDLRLEDEVMFYLSKLTKLNNLYFVLATEDLKVANSIKKDFKKFIFHQL